MRSPREGGGRTGPHLPIPRATVPTRGRTTARHHPALSFPAGQLTAGTPTGQPRGADGSPLLSGPGDTVVRDPRCALWRGGGRTGLPPRSWLGLGTRQLRGQPGATPPGRTSIGPPHRNTRPPSHSGDRGTSPAPSPVKPVVCHSNSMITERVCAVWALNPFRSCRHDRSRPVAIPAASPRLRSAARSAPGAGKPTKSPNRYRQTGAHHRSARAQPRCALQGAITNARRMPPLPPARNRQEDAAVRTTTGVTAHALRNVPNPGPRL